jgi:hypothetical protein
LRYLAYKIVSSNELDYKKIMLVSGTREDHANNVKERMQSLFEKRFPLDSKYEKIKLDYTVGLDKIYDRKEILKKRSEPEFPFVTEHKKLLQHLYNLISNEYLCIPESMEKVIISLKSAVANEYSLDKSQSPYNDTLDAPRLAVKPYRFD